MEAAKKRAQKRQEEVRRGAGEHRTEHRKDLRYGWPAGLVVSGHFPLLYKKKYSNKNLSYDE
ncbi:hypothetical protein E2C01_041969 [Portunus trituberculatus]|uniref:Uncharacterized protein n=1 Tax=Portunus trituberculatus TaxID=210409 RepID=A0A5B7FNX8_PORTR|nr:hypothetical protein [Portunus trituberculatus]